MNLKTKLLPAITVLLLFGCSTGDKEFRLDKTKLAQAYYQQDSQWYIDNIPFFECSDKEIEQVYYYRWKLYKAHIRNTGDNRFVITEFINHVAWDRDPECTINAASMHHIYEGRWLKDPRYMDGYINYLFQDGGNNRKYSESVADAAYARYLVNADSAFVIKQLDSMKSIYNQWSDHWDSTKQMYWIPAMPDATEYTVASIDGTGGKEGFDGGEAFRPTINSYMYANAKAISFIGAMAHDPQAADWLQRANNLAEKIRNNLWNDSLNHFIDRYKMDNQYVHYWNFIRNRELAGMIPWYYNIPYNSQKQNSAWKHVLDTMYLLGSHGLRTNEPAYQYYFKQFVYYMGQRGSQWNGPSWPYQTSQVINAFANFLNDADQNIATSSDYLKLLRQYTKQHYLPDGKINLVENYDPNLGGPIVYYYWSNHYNHSSYNDLVISGLCGVRASKDNMLTINPLIDSTIQYFALDDVQYHGHKLTVVYDRDGSKYNIGKGLTVFVDDKKVDIKNKQVNIGSPIVKPVTKWPVNYALNITRKGFPTPTASVNINPDTSLYQAVDGRTWYFPEITNRWTTEGSTLQQDWYAIDFGKTVDISTMKMYLFTDDKTFAVPDSVTIDYHNGIDWMPVKGLKVEKLIGNTVNTIHFDKAPALKIRINFKHTKQVAISEIECYDVSL